MLYRRLADVVVVIHAIVALFFLFGAFLCWQFSYLALIHVPLAAWVTLAFIMGWTCPLTPLENRLRKAAGEQGYEGSFVDRYVGPLLGAASAADQPTAPSSNRPNEIILGVLFGVVSLALHGANIGTYHDAIWPPPSKPPIAPVSR